MTSSCESAFCGRHSISKNYASGLRFVMFCCGLALFCYIHTLQNCCIGTGVITDCPGTTIDCPCASEATLKEYAIRWLNQMNLPPKTSKTWQNNMHISLQWHEGHGVSKPRQLHYLLNSAFRQTAKRTPKLRITGPLLEKSTDDRWVPLTKV